MQLLDANETARRTGTSAYKGSLFEPRAGAIQPLAYCHGLARAAIAKGASVHSHSPFPGVNIKNGDWVLEANGRTVRAKRLLLATNAYQLGIEMPFKPRYTPVSYRQFATEPMQASVRSQLLPGGEGCWDTAMVMSSFRTDQTGRMIVGGIGNTEGLGSAIHRAWTRRKLRRLFPAIGDVKFEYVWRGRIAMTDDHIPKVGAFGPNAYACFGYSGRGIAPGTVFGTQAAVALLGDSPDALPIKPLSHYSERFSAIKASYYEIGATAAHAF